MVVTGDIHSLPWMPPSIQIILLGLFRLREPPILMTLNVRPSPVVPMSWILHRAPHMSFILDNQAFIWNSLFPSKKIANPDAILRQQVSTGVHKCNLPHHVNCSYSRICRCGTLCYRIWRLSAYPFSLSMHQTYLPALCQPAFSNINIIHTHLQKKITASIYTNTPYSCTSPIKISYFRLWWDSKDFVCCRKGLGTLKSTSWPTLYGCVQKSI